MSMFLGPIHYWLYNKIGNQEELTKRIAACAEQSGWIDNSSEYTKDLPPLEEVIDESNIHGWLQGCISDAETRYARLVTRLQSHMEQLKEIAYKFGEDNALEADVTAQAAYEAFENFFVNGMPCDRVNVVTENTEDIVSWNQAQDIHAPYWIENNCDAAPYYTLRKSVMDGMLSETEFELKMLDTAHYFITKKNGGFTNGKQNVLFSMRTDRRL